MAPRRRSAVIDPSKAVSVRRPSRMRTERTSADSRHSQRDIGSVRWIGRLHRFGAPVIAHFCASSVISTGMRANPSAERRVPNDFDLRVGSSSILRSRPADGDLEAEGAAGGQRDGPRLAVRRRPAAGDAQHEQQDGDDSGVEQVLQQPRGIILSEPHAPMSSTAALSSRPRWLPGCAARAGPADRAVQRRRRPPRGRRRGQRRRSPTDDPGFFNYTDYEYSALRNVRLGVCRPKCARASGFRCSARCASTTATCFEPFALLRAHPSVGRIAASIFRWAAFRRRSALFGRGTYGTHNLLIGTPLAYQYLTSLRPDALPLVNDDLLRMRGRGWLSNFPVGNTAPDRGLPIVNSYPVGHRRAGARRQRHARMDGCGHDRVALQSARGRRQRRQAGRGTRGRASDCRQLAIGGSFARGAYPGSSLEDALPAGPAVDDARAAGDSGSTRSTPQGRFLGRSEVIWSRWTLPLSPPVSDDDTADRRPRCSPKARYRILPGVHVAARGERLDFGHIADEHAGLQQWDAPVAALRDSAPAIR